MHNITFRNETPNDYRTIEHLTREAFWNVYRSGCLEHYVLPGNKETLKNKRREVDQRNIKIQLKQHWIA